MNNNNKITLGFVLAAVSTILSAVCAFLYKSALMKDSRTYAFLNLFKKERKGDILK